VAFLLDAGQPNPVHPSDLEGCPTPRMCLGLILSRVIEPTQRRESTFQG
jgi:hypothetical protein